MLHMIIDTGKRSDPGFGVGSCCRFASGAAKHLDAVSL
jgi:hypothetical protein